MKQQSLHLIAHAICPYVQRSIITLEEKNIPYTRTDIELADKPLWFNQKSPMGKVPILLVDEKHALFESAIICEYLDEITPNSLHPIDELEKAYHRAWIEFGSSILNKIASLYNAKEATQFQKFHAEIQGKFIFLERELNTGPYFSGDEFHLIDAVYGPIFRYFEVFDSFSNLETFKDVPKCLIWRKTLNERSSIKNAVSKNYSKDLIKFLLSRESHISNLIRETKNK